MATDRINAMAATNGIDDDIRTSDPTADVTARIADAMRLLGAPRVATMATAMAALAAAQAANGFARIPTPDAANQMSPASNARNDPESRRNRREKPSHLYDFSVTRYSR